MGFELKIFKVKQKRINVSAYNKVPQRNFPDAVHILIYLEDNLIDDLLPHKLVMLRGAVELI